MNTPPEDPLASSWIEVSNDEPVNGTNTSQQSALRSRSTPRLQQPAGEPYKQGISSAPKSFGAATNYDALREAMAEINAQQTVAESTFAEMPRVPVTGDVVVSERAASPQEQGESSEPPPHEGADTSSLELDVADKVRYRTTIEDVPPEEEVADLRRDLAKLGLDLDFPDDTAGSSTGLPPLPPGIINDIVTSIFTPGVQPGVLFVMNLAFYALFLTLTGLAILTKGNVHVLIFLALSVGLFASIQWFLKEMEHVKKQDAKPKSE